MQLKKDHITHTSLISIKLWCFTSTKFTVKVKGHHLSFSCVVIPSFYNGDWWWAREVWKHKNQCQCQKLTGTNRPHFLWQPLIFTLLHCSLTVFQRNLTKTCYGLVLGEILCFFVLLLPTEHLLQFVQTTDDVDNRKVNKKPKFLINTFPINTH